MIARVAESKAFVDRLLENHWGQNVLCVTHGYAIRIFMAAVLGIPLESTRFFMAGNTAVSIIEYKRPEMPQMRVFGDISPKLTCTGVFSWGAARQAVWPQIWQRAAGPRPCCWKVLPG